MSDTCALLLWSLYVPVSEIWGLLSKSGSIWKGVKIGAPNHSVMNYNIKAWEDEWHKEKNKELKVMGEDPQKIKDPARGVREIGRVGDSELRMKLSARSERVRRVVEVGI